MTTPHSLRRAAKNAMTSSPLLQDPAALRAPDKPQLRRYEVASLLPNGNISETRHIAPALPLFEDAFCAFTRGSLVETEQGPVAIEDLWPGDRVHTHDGQYLPLLWKGCTTLIPGRTDTKGRSHRLTSIMADSFGIQKPMSTVIAGPSARLMQTPPHLRSAAQGRRVLTRASEFQDGMNVFDTAPPTPVELFHLCLPVHAVINVGGLEFGTYHPGLTALRLVSHAVRSLYLNLFSHINQLADFGPQAFPRVEELDNTPLSA